MQVSFGQLRLRLRFHALASLVALQIELTKQTQHSTSFQVLTARCETHETQSWRRKVTARVGVGGGGDRLMGCGTCAREFRQSENLLARTGPVRA